MNRKSNGVHTSQRSLHLCENRYLSQRHVDLIIRGAEAADCADKLEAALGPAPYKGDPFELITKLRALVAEWRGAQVTDITDADGQEAERG
jgi:hypothetical protein